MKTTHCVALYNFEEKYQRGTSIEQTFCGDGLYH